MTLPIKDGNAAVTALKSTLDGTDHVVHRHIDSMPATAASSGTPSIPAKVLMVGAQNPSAKCVPLSVDSSGFLNTAATITGGATETKQDTIIGHVDGIEGLLGTIDADTSLLSGCVDSTKLKAILQANDGVDIGNVDVASVAIPSAVKHGYKDVASAGTALAIGGSQAITSGVTVKAYASNTGLVFVGDSTVTNASGAYKGFELSAKESHFIEVDNINKVYVDAAVTGEGVCWIAS